MILANDQLRGPDRFSTSATGLKSHIMGLLESPNPFQHLGATPWCNPGTSCALPHPLATGILRLPHSCGAKSSPATLVVRCEFVVSPNSLSLRGGVTRRTSSQHRSVGPSVGLRLISVRHSLSIVVFFWYMCYVFN